MYKISVSLKYQICVADIQVCGDLC